MTSEFKVGDRVRYIKDIYKDWGLSEGTITCKCANGIFRVKFDSNTNAYRYQPEHYVYASKIEYIPYQDEYIECNIDDLVKGDEIEVIIKTKVQAVSESILNTDHNFIDRRVITSVKKKTPIATKLEVSDVLVSTLNKGIDYVVRLIGKNEYVTECHTGFAIVSKYDDYTKSVVHRKSGIPIDWEATFNV